MPATATDRIDGLTTSVAVKAPCRAVTTANITLSGLQTVNGVSLADGDRVLVKNQTDTTANGIYVASTSAWSRARDFDGTRDAVKGTIVIVITDADTAGQSIYRLTTADPVEFGSSAITFVESVFGAVDSLAITYLRSATGAVSRSGRDKWSDWVSVKDFGAACDGVTDDSTAIQAAINYFGGAGPTAKNDGGVVLIPGGCAIGSTISINNKAVVLLGSSWGNSTTTVKNSFLKWTGSAGSPMIKIQDGFGAGVENLRLIGKSTAKPSAAIEIAQSGGGQTNAFTALRRLWIGNLGGLDSDNANQFTNGIIFTGTVNGDSNALEHIRITGCDSSGIDFQNGNASDTHLNGVYIQSCAIGIKSIATICGTNVLVTNSTTTDISLGGGGKFLCDLFVSESSARLCQFTGAAAKLILKGGSWQAMTAKVAGDGFIIDTGSNSQWVIDLEGFSLQYEAGYSAATPVIRAFNTSLGGTVGFLRLVGTWGIYPANINVGTMQWTNDARSIIYEPAPESGQDPMPRQHLHLSWELAADQTFQVWRNDFCGKLNVFGGPVATRRFVKPVNVAATNLSGTGATTYSYKVTALSYDGETDCSVAATCSNNAVLSSSAKNRVSWNPVQGAYAYKVYGRTGGSEVLMATVAWTTDLHPGKNNSVAPPHWDDDGSIVPAGAQPTSNTTGNATVEGKLTLSNSGGSATSYQTPLLLGTYSLWVDSAGKLRISSSAPSTDTSGTIVGTQT